MRCCWRPAGNVTFDGIDQRIEQIEPAMNIAHDIVALTLGNPWALGAIRVAAEQFVQRR